MTFGAQPRSSLLLVAVLSMVSLLAACAGSGDRDSLMGREDGETQGAASTTTGTKSTATPTAPTETVDGQDPNHVGPLPTGTTAKAYFVANVQPALGGSCGGCHNTGPGPSWIVPSDAEKSYTLIFGRGYIIRESILLKKGAHSGGTAPGLTTEQNKTVATWIELEMKERGDKAPPSVLAKMGDCMDRAKFDAIGWEKIETITRTANNNPNGEQENANECMGCKPTTCAVCHSADPGSGFVMAEGSPFFDKDYTFKESKKTSPAYLQKYFGLDTNGDPKPSQGIRMKSDNTYYQAKAYQHPMFRLTAEQEAAIDDFVADAIAKYKAGQCGK